MVLGAAKCLPLSVFLADIKEYQKVELPKSEAGLVTVVATGAGVHEGCVGLSVPKFVG